jgi:hypothetical protein
VHLAVADHHVGLPREDRRDQARDVGSAILIVGVEVDDDVGAESHRGAQAENEHPRQSLIATQAQNVLDPGEPRRVGGAVGRAVVDDEDFDLVDPCDLARHVGNDLRQVLRLVEAGNLHDELHRAPPRRRLSGSGGIMPAR